MALGLRLDGSDARVFCEFSDGELQEGSTWEAAMAASTFKCDRLIALVDCNGIQADGPVIAAIEPVARKFEAFGFDTVEIDGNDMQALIDALTMAREQTGRPKCIVMRTIPGKGVPTIMNRPRAHFVRVDNNEWDALIAELETANG
jgi:transketolase